MIRAQNIGPKMPKMSGRVRVKERISSEEGSSSLAPTLL
jgi:hypothetical protein